MPPSNHIMPSPPESVLLLGAGELGTAILSAIAAHPSLASTRITLALRPATIAATDASSASRRAHLHSLHPHLTLAGLDLSAPEAKADLTALIRSRGGHDTVIGCTGYAGSGSNNGTQALIAEAVFESRDVVRRYFPWQFGADYDAIHEDTCGGLMKEQCGVRRFLRSRAEEAGVEWTIVSTGMFMSFVFEDWFGVVEGLFGDNEVVARGLGGWENKVTLTAAEDIGRCVAEMLVNPVERNDQGGSVVFIAGETVSYGRLADVVETVIGERGRKVKREEWPLELLEKDLEKDPESQIQKYRTFFGAGKGVSWDVGGTFNAQRGMSMVGVEEWVRGKLGLPGTERK